MVFCFTPFHFSEHEKLRGVQPAKADNNCSMIDLFDRSVVATLNSSHMDAELAVETRRAALKRNHPPKNLVVAQ